MTASLQPIPAPAPARPGSLPIRGQLALLVAAAVLPLVVLAAIVTYSAASHDIEASRAGARAVSAVIATNVDRFIDEAELQLAGIAQLPLVRLVDGTRCDPVLSALAPLEPAFTNVGVVDLEGRVVCSAAPQPGGTAASVAALPWFEAALASPGLSIGEPHIGPISGKWVSILTYPVRGAEGDLRGLVGMSIDLDRFNQFIGHPTLDERAVVTIVTGDGIVVARSVEAETFVGTDARGTDVVDELLADVPGPASAVGVDGVDRIYGSVAILSTGWYVVAGIPTDVVLADARAIVAAAILLGLITSVAVLALTSWIGRGIASPLRALASAARTVAAGDLDGRATVAGPAEVAETALAFNDMIDARRAANEARDAAMAQLETLVRTAPIGIAFVDRDLRFIRINEALAEINGYTPEEHLGHTIPELFPEGWPTIEPYYRRVLDEGVAIKDLEVVGRTPAQPGVDRTWMTSYYPVDGQGRVGGVDGVGGIGGVGIVVREMSAERAATRELERRQHRIENLHRLEASIVRAENPGVVVESAMDAVRSLLDCRRTALYRVDLEAGTRTLVNLVGEGVDASAIGRVGPLPDVVAQAIRSNEPLMLSDLRPLAEHDPSFAGAIGAGTLAMLILPLPGPNPLLLIANWQDVHVLREDETAVLRETGDILAIAFRQADLFAQVAAHAEELEDRVEERTRQLTEINAELDAFSYTMSHDLRAPLRAMQGFASALVEDESDRLSPTGREFAERIVRAGERMEELIGDLLEYSRLSRAAIRPEPIDLDQVAAVALSQVVSTLAGAGADVQLAPSLGRAVGHRASLTQAIANLLTNAAKFVPAGTAPRIRLDTVCTGATVRLCVTDNGIGVPAEHAERIFGVFERLHGQESFAGTGIGLAIVRKAAERMGGSAGVSAAPGGGSTFWVELPAAEEREVAA